MVKQVEALVTHDTRGIFVRGKVPIRDCNPNDVEIEVYWAGICHSDYHQAKAEWGGTFVYPMVPGHEIAGVVAAVGNKVTKYKVGDRVGVGCFVDSCRECEMCKIGEEQYCVPGNVSTYNQKLSPEFQKKKNYPDDKTYGGYSQRVVVDENYVCKVPDSLNLEDIAPILCAGITLYSPLKYYGARDGGSNFSVAIVGLGGLGDMGVKLAKKMGNKVSVVSTSERKRDYVENTLGAEFIYSGNTDQERDAMAARYGSTFDLVIYTSSALDKFEPYLKMVKTNGTLCIVGAPPKPISFNAFDVIFQRRKIGGSLIGGIKETQEVLDFCAQHKLVSGVEKIKASEVNRAYKEMGLYTAGKQRFVIDVKNTLVEGDWDVDMSPVKESASHVVGATATIIGAENTAGKTYYPDKDQFVAV